MSATWKTKWGVRRVRRDTPTIEEALIAAESLAADPVQRAEIAATLMGVPVEEVKALAAKQAARTRGRASLVTGRTRAVVVEYKRPRIGHGPMSFASKRYTSVEMMAIAIKVSGVISAKSTLRKASATTAEKAAAM